MREETERVAMEGPTLIIDGQCNLCLVASGFVAESKADKGERDDFRFMWAQHRETIELCERKFGLSREDLMKSWTLIEKGKVSRGADAWLEASKYMKMPWRVVGKLGWIVPRCIRDAVYGWVANNRYKLFGATQECRRPEKGFFLHEQGA